ncbi:polyprenyl synthetase family protein [Paenibacillus tarimensis]
MSIFIPEISALMRVPVEDHFHEPELRRLALEFLEYKAAEISVFGQLAALHCRMFGGDEELADCAAAASELAILALDIYDDLQDNDNDSAPWSKVEPFFALNVAIGLQALSLETIRRGLRNDPGKATAALAILNRSVIRAVNGQHADLRNEFATEEECLRMIAEKSGALVAGVCLAGTAMATGDYNDIVAAYGEAIGVAAQIRNDIAGIERWDRRNDILFRKRTLPVLFVLEQAGEEASLLQAYYEQRISKEELLDNKVELMRYIRSCGCIEYAHVIARLKGFDAESALMMLQVDDYWKEQLRYYM